MVILSERAEFCERLAAENIIFVGPPVKAIEAMGDKITSKENCSRCKCFHSSGSHGIN